MSKPARNGCKEPEPTSNDQGDDQGNDQAREPARDDHTVDAAQDRDACEQAEHGRQASRPGEIPRPGWRDIVWRVYQEYGRDHVPIMAAGVAFYALLAIVPAIAALVAIYGLVSDPSEVRSQIAALRPILPREVQRFLVDQLGRAIAHSNQALSIGAFTSIALSLWSATRGTKALITAVNVAYEEREQRSFLMQNVVGVVFTLGAILGTLVALGLVVVLPSVMDLLGLSGWTGTAVSLLRWPLLFVSVMFGIGLLYYFGPTRARAQRHWVSWGAVMATSLWLLGSVLFSLYISHFGSFDKTYGSLGAVVILLLWFFVSALVIILGAELNAEIEHQTCIDSTVGDPKPMGQRGAYVADHVGASRDRT